MTRTIELFNALIRTHHITSRRKVHRLRKAAVHHGVDFVLIRSGGAPGIMYAESRRESAVAAWVAAVQALRYKDYRCVCKPAAVSRATVDAVDSVGADEVEQFKEVESVADFAEEMECRGLGGWWRRGMGWETE